MQHDPHVVSFVEAQLYEVVPATERAKLAQHDHGKRILAALPKLRVLLLDPRLNFREQRAGAIAVPIARLVRKKSDRNGMLYFRADLNERIGQMLGPRASQPHCRHSASD